MLDNTKSAIKSEIEKWGVFSDPAPMPGSGVVNVAKALVDDVVQIVKNDSNGKQQ